MKNIIFILLFSTTIFAQTSASALYEESQKALSSGNLELAGEKVKAAIDLDKTNDSFRKEFDRLNGLRNKMINANRSVQDGRFDDAIAGFSDVISNVPNSVEAYYGIAKAFEGKKDFTSAVENYKKSLSIDPNYINITSPNRHAFFKNFEPFINHWIETSLYNFLFTNRPPFNLFFLGKAYY